MPTGDCADSLPSARSASVEPTIVHVWTPAAVHVEDLGGAPEAERGIGRVALDDQGVALALAQSLDLRLEVSLVLLGDVVLGVLAEVAELSRGEDTRGDRSPSAGFELLQLGLQRDQAGGRDRFAVRGR